MSWVLFSILAALVWATVNTIDKYILTKLVRNPIIPIIFLGVIGLIASIFVYLFRGLSYLSYPHIALAFIAGISYVLMNFFYFKAVRIEEISRVVPLFYLEPIFILVLAAILLKEVFTPLTYVGIFLLVFGVVLVSSRKFLNLSFGKAFWLMIFSTLALSIESIILKYLLGFADFWTIFSYVRVGAFFVIIPFFYLNNSVVAIPHL